MITNNKAKEVPFSKITTVQIVDYPSFKRMVVEDELKNGTSAHLKSYIESILNTLMKHIQIVKEETGKDLTIADYLNESLKLAITKK